MTLLVGQLEGHLALILFLLWHYICCLLTYLTISAKGPVFGDQAEPGVTVEKNAG